MPRRNAAPDQGQTTLQLDDACSLPATTVETPRAFLTSPFFAAVPQPPGSKRLVTVGEYSYEIGGPVVTTKRTDALYPALDVRHGELILASTRFWNRSSHNIEFSLSALCAEMGVQKGGAQYERMLELFQDLSLTAVRKRHHTQIEDDRRFPILKEVLMRGANEVRGVVLDARFAEMLYSQGETLSVRIDQLVSIRRTTAKALYLFMPSRAWHHTEKNPFRRTLTNVLAEIGCKPIPHRAQRRARFERAYRGNPSVLDELNGAEIPGGILRCDIAPTSDGEDHNLMMWVERRGRIEPENKSALHLAWLKSGRADADFFRMKPALLDDYERDQIRAAQVNLDGCMQFLERAKGLLPRHIFLGRVGDVKASIMGGGTRVANPTGALINSLLSAVEGGL